MTTILFYNITDYLIKKLKVSNWPLYITWWLLGFPGSSAGKESTCNAGDSISSPGWERSPGEGIGYPLQYSWASLVAQIVKNPFAMWETWVRSLGWEDPLEKGLSTHSSILAWRIPVDRGAWRLQSMRSQSWTGLSDQAHTAQPCAIQ